MTSLHTLLMFMTRCKSVTIQSSLLFSPFTLQLFLQFFVTLSHCRSMNHIVLLFSLILLLFHDSTYQHATIFQVITPFLKLFSNSLHWTQCHFFVVFAIECVSRETILIGKWTLTSLIFHLQRRIMFLIPWNRMRYISLSSTLTSLFILKYILFSFFFSHNYFIYAK